MSCEEGLSTLVLLSGANTTLVISISWAHTRVFIRVCMCEQSRKDSQGICFLGRLKFEDFVGHHLGERPGIVIDYHTGEVLGEHK